MVARELEEGRTLLVSGPASVTLIEGRAETLGTSIPIKSRVVIRGGRVLPFYASEKSLMDVVLGKNAESKEVFGDTIPNSWIESVQDILTLEHPCIVMVIGDTDSGKTTFCTFLANKALEKVNPVGIIDGDIGQADIGAPTTIGLGVIKSPITDLFTVKTKNAYFVGITSPSDVAANVIHGMTLLKREATELGLRFIIVNTDGWVQGDDAKSYKVEIAKAIKPNAVVGIQWDGELISILNAFEAEGVKIYSLKASVAVRERNKEERRGLRELGYKKFLRGPRISFLPMNWIKIENSIISTGRPLLPERLGEFESLLGCRLAYGEETPHTLFLVLRRGGEVEAEDVVLRLAKSVRKKIRLATQGDETGLLVSLLDDKRRFLGLGRLVEIDFKKLALRIATPIKARASIVQFGRIKLDRECGEVGISDTFAI